MTSIEFLIEELIESQYFPYGTPIILIKQAKEMEKQQLYNFYVQGGIDCVTQADRTVEQYYNETFKNTKK